MLLIMALHRCIIKFTNLVLFSCARHKVVNLTSPFLLHCHEYEATVSIPSNSTLTSAIHLVYHHQNESSQGRRWVAFNLKKSDYQLTCESVQATSL